MTDAAEAWLEVRAVERILDPTSGTDRLRVRFEYGSQGGILCEWAIWLPDEDGFDAAIALARAELRRICASAAVGDLAGPT